MDDLSGLVEEARRLSSLVDQGVAALRNSAKDVAKAERDYRLAKAQAWAEAKGDLAKEREAWVNAETADLRMVRDVAEGTRQAAMEALRSRRVQLDMLRSILSATRSEMELAR